MIPHPTLGMTGLSGLSALVDSSPVDPPVLPPYTPALQYNDARNSMYALYLWIW